MRELFSFFGQKYSAVTTNYNNNNNHKKTEIHLKTNLSASGNEQEQSGKKFQAKQAFARGCSLLDSLFHQRKAGKTLRWPRGAFLLMACGICAVTSATIMYILQPYLAIFKWKLIFAENGEIFNLWQKPPVNLYIKIYLFNITNADKFMKGEEKLKVQEVGPYVYRELLLHDEVIFNENGTLSTIPKHPLVWSEELSKGSEDDILMLPNIALLSITQVTAEKPYFFRLPINLIIRQTNSQPLVKMTAREFMFGYESPLTTLGNRFMPNWIYFEKVGLIDRMYDFSGDFETIYSGETDESISGLYDTYRGSRDLQQWKGNHCSNINMASDGTKFKSFIQPNETLLFFRKSMCRPQRMIRVGEEVSISSLSAFKYVFEENAMDNGHIDKRNKCFCKDDKCLMAGLLDISDCYYGFPIALSYPHFLDSDEHLVNSIEGSKPNRTLHESYFMIQPLSGLPLKLSVKFQINMAMRDVSNMANVEHFSNMVIPMTWFEITLNALPESLNNRFILYLNILPAFEGISQLVIFVAGILLLAIAVTKAAMKFSKSLAPSSTATTTPTTNTTTSSTSTTNNTNNTLISYKLSRRYSTIASNKSDYISNCDNLSYETTENCIRNSDPLYSVDFIDERKYMLEEEPAISENESDDDHIDYMLNGNNDVERINRNVKTNLCFETKNGSVNRVNENDLFISQSLHKTESTTNICQLGDTSSNLDDLGNDNFHELQISDEEDKEQHQHQHNEQDCLRRQTSSADSISIVLDNADLI